MKIPFFLQIAADSISNVLNETTPIGSLENTSALSIWELTLKGGWIMIVLGILSVLAIYLFVSKLLELKSASREDTSFLDRIKDYVSTDRVDAAISLCKSTDTPSSRVLGRLLSCRGRSLEEMMAIVENAGGVEAGRLQKSMPLLATIAAGAPMIGFLGTVTGMVKAFYDMASSSNAVDISLLSSGIYEALVTTVGGLIVGIITLFIYNYLVARINNVLNHIETTALGMTDFLSVLHEENRRAKG